MVFIGGQFPETMQRETVFMTMKHYLAVEIGGTKLQVALGDGAGLIEERWRAEVRPEWGGEGIREQLAKIIEEVLVSREINAVGVGFGGPVDWGAGTICCSHQIRGWSEFPLADWIRERTGVRVFVENDANVAALGEALNGAGKGMDPVFYTTLGSGVGGGLVVRGRIYHGARPGESEIGHLRLDRAGAIVESRCSGWAVDARIRDEIRRNPTSLLSEMCRGMERGEARHLGLAVEAGDQLACSILKDTAEDLAFALSHVIHLMHPSVLVVGGGLSLLGEPLRDKIARALPCYVMEAMHPVPEVRLAALGEDSVPVGALLLAASGGGRDLDAS